MSVTAYNDVHLSDDTIIWMIATQHNISDHDVLFILPLTVNFPFVVSLLDTILHEYVLLSFKLTSRTVRIHCDPVPLIL